MDAERREQPPDVFQFIIHDDHEEEDRRARDVELLIDPKYFPLSLPRSLHLPRGLIIGQQAANKRLTLCWRDCHRIAQFQKSGEDMKTRNSWQLCLYLCIH